MHARLCKAIHSESKNAKSLAHVSVKATRQITPPLSSASSDTSDTSSSLDSLEAVPAVDDIRTLEECINIFENGPRPVSESLALLNDEEVIMLAQCGKIAAYALEKVLGMDELERAVRIRRALICMSYLDFLWVIWWN